MWLPWQLTKHLGKHAGEMQQFLTADFTGADAETRKRKAGDVRQLSAVAAGAIAPMPIPFADFWTITPIQILMVTAIANIYGHKIDPKTARAILATVGGGWLGKQTFLALMKLGLPGVGEAASAGFAYFWTLGMGRAAEAYFASGMTASRQQMRQAITDMDPRNQKPLRLPPIQ